MEILKIGQYANQYKESAVRRDLTAIAISTAVDAAKLVMSMAKEKNFNKFIKPDGTPVTNVDLLTSSFIKSNLAKTGFSVISEEDAQIDNDQLGESYWLIDPLDGTKNFLAGRDDFSINIAMISAGAPVIGVVCAPAQCKLYYSYKPSDFDCYHINSEDTKNQNFHELIMLASVYHDTPEADSFAKKNGILKKINVGAALKFVHLSRLIADVYPRFVGTSEWDTAAGQCILEASGGCVIDLSTNKKMSYGKSAMRNGNFIAIRPGLDFFDFKI